MIKALCLQCGEPSFLTEEEEEKTFGCPKCGDTLGIPADLDDQVDLTITSHELRILTHWADNYTALMYRYGLDPERRMGQVMKVILDRLSMQTNVPLSLGQELADLRSAMSEKGYSVDIVLIDGDGNCMECHQPVDIEDVADHRCGVPLTHEISLDDLPPLETTDEHGTETNKDEPPYSS